MVTFHGWKRFELNDIMKFHGFTETTWVINCKGRFVSAERLAQLPPGVHGCFLMQEDMKDFVTSPPAAGALFTIIMGDLSDFSEKLEKYADGGGDGGLTRATMRSLACPSQKRRRQSLCPSHVSRHAPVGAARVAAHGVESVDSRRSPHGE